MLKIQLDDAKFTQIRDYIYDKSGMYFANSKKYLLEDRISRRMEELRLDKFDNYFYYLKYDNLKEVELKKLFDEVTTNETYFYRNIPHIEAFRSVIFPEIVKLKKEQNKRKITIWSAACSSGEEAYTLAILIKEVLGSDFKNWDIKILATDISNSILEKAQKGIYTRNSLRNVTQSIKTLYFKQIDNRYYLNDDIKNMVTFQYMNLIERIKMRMIRGVDIIFCRNVLIYFDQKSKKQVVSSLYNSLVDNGYLFIGHSESLHGIFNAFKLVHLTNAMVYKKQR